MIRNIVFDMGNVLIYFDRDIFLSRVGLKDPADRELLKREVYLSLEWACLDSGALTPKEAEPLMCARLPERLHGYVRRLVSEWARPILPVPGMEQLVRELKANGYGIYLLSNAAVDQHDYWPSVPGSDCFDGTVISADEKCVKPEQRIYGILCERFSLNPGECLFIDDAGLNAEGAVRFGMQALVFHNDVPELRRKLREAGVRCGEG